MTSSGILTDYKLEQLSNISSNNSVIGGISTCVIEEQL